MAITLYDRQRKIITFLRQYIQKNRYAPTLKEIGKAIGVNSPATVHEHLMNLQRKGIIRRTKGVTRGLEIIDEEMGSLGAVTLPLLGFIAAGKPIEPHTDPEASLTVSPHLLSGQRRAYTLQVKGNSMVDDGILDGDYVIIEHQDTAKNGDIVVALLDNGFATLKRFFKEATRVRLEPANAKMKPIFAKKVRIQGKVVGIIRNFS